MRYYDFVERDRKLLIPVRCTTRKFYLQRPLVGHDDWNAFDQINVAEIAPAAPYRYYFVHTCPIIAKRMQLVS